MNDKVLWVTGASSGIGAAVAKKFAKEGWKVAISARRVELLNVIAEDQKNIYSYPLDVTNAIQLKETFNKIVNDLGKVDMCILSSGTYERKSEKEIDVNNIKNVIEVNFLGVINSVAAVESYFKIKKMVILQLFHHQLDIEVYLNPLDIRLPRLH